MRLDCPAIELVRRACWLCATDACNHAAVALSRLPSGCDTWTAHGSCPPMCLTCSARGPMRVPDLKRLEINIEISSDALYMDALVEAAGSQWSVLCVGSSAATMLNGVFCV